MRTLATSAATALVGTRQVSGSGGVKGPALRVGDNDDDEDGDGDEDDAYDGDGDDDDAYECGYRDTPASTDATS